MKTIHDNPRCCGTLRRVCRVLAAGLALGALPAQGLDVEVSAYGAASGVPSAMAATIHFHANATSSQTLEFDVRVPGGAGKSVGLFLGLSQMQMPLGPGVVLVDPLLWQAQQLDGTGSTRFSLALPNALGGTLFAQAIAVDFAAPSSMFVFSHGLRVDIVQRSTTSIAFDAGRARTLMDLAWHAYEYPAANGRLGPITPGRLLPGDFRVVEEISSPAPSGQWFQQIGWPETYLFIAQNTAGDVAVVFRGTNSVQDWMNDFMFPQSSGYHGGILLAYSSVHLQIAASLQRLVRPSTRVYFTGHSLGGGLAPIAALHQEQHLTNLGVARRDIVLYSFAGPRVLSPTRAAQLDSQVPHHFAVANKDDVVTHVPLPNTLGYDYRHTPRMRVLYPRGAMVAEHGSDYAMDLLPPLTPLTAAHHQDVYYDRLGSILPAPQVWLTVSSTGYMRIHWSFPARAQHGFGRDFIALYRGVPDPADPSGHINNAWQWASSSGSYTTNVPKGRDMHVAYVQQFAPLGEQKILGDDGPYTWPTPNVSLTTTNGWATLNWSTQDPGSHDYVALYDRNPTTAGPNGYVLGQWQWATQGRSWVTWRWGRSGYWIAYIEDDNHNPPRIVRTAGPY